MRCKFAKTCRALRGEACSKDFLYGVAKKRRDCGDFLSKIVGYYSLIYWGWVGFWLPQATTPRAAHAPRIVRRLMICQSKKRENQVNE